MKREQPELAWVLSRIAEDELLQRALEAHRRGAAEDSAHDAGHVLRVALWTLRIGGDDVDPREALLAALLHDVVNVPKDSPERGRASELSAERALQLIGDALSPESRARVAAAIRDHSFSRGARPDSPLGRALADADRLEALGAIGLLRTAATGARLGASFFHPEDPWAESRPLDDARHTLDHFFTKLLGLPEQLHTETARREARARADFLRLFITQLGRELERPAPDAHGGARRD